MDGVKQKIGMSVFRETYYIYRRNLRVWFVPATFLPPLFMSGLLYVLFASTFTEVTNLGGFSTEDYSAFLVSWIIVQAVVFSGGDAGFALLTDMMSGYFDKLLLAPINRFSILFGSLLVAATRGMLQAVVIIAIALALGVSFQGGILGILTLILFAAVFGLAWSCLSIIIALKTKSVQATQSSFLLFFPFIFITTAFVPEELLSGWFKVAVKVNPVTYVTEAMRAIVIEGWEWNTIITGLWVTVVMVGFLMIVTTWLFRRATA